MTLQIETQQAWLMLTTGERRTHHGHDGYDDVPDSHYSWDNTVPNHGKPQVGDLIVIWNRDGLVGFSIIEQIYFEEGVPKVRKRCPFCNATNIHLRVNRKPDFNCRKCNREFAEPTIENIDVNTYRSEHGRNWTEAREAITTTALRECCFQLKSQHSIRQLDTAKFSIALKFNSPELVDTLTLLQQGHRIRPVSVRIGQSAFRKHLFELYGSVCAVTGEHPQEVLEAAHLYSFAETGAHISHGGLLLRRDIHRLFDLGMMAVDSNGACILLSQELRNHVTYKHLHGELLKVPLNIQQRKWLQIHREQFDAPLPELT